MSDARPLNINRDRAGLLARTTCDRPPWTCPCRRQHRSRAPQPAKETA